MDFNPSPEVTMRAGDQIVVLGRPDGLKALDLEARLQHGAAAGADA